MKNIKNR